MLQEPRIVRISVERVLYDRGLDPFDARHQYVNDNHLVGVRTKAKIP